MAKEMSGSLLGLLDNLAGKKPQDEGEANKTAADSVEGQVKH